MELIRSPGLVHLKMVLDFVFYSRQILPALVFAVSNLDGVVRALTAEDQGRKVAGFLSLHVLYDQIPCFLLERLHILCVLPFATEIVIHFLVTPDVPGQM